MCRTLGWHRLSDTRDESNGKKAGLFWFCYTQDKMLSLRFGRSSIFQDWDISTPRRSAINTTANNKDANASQKIDPLQGSFDTWAEHARMQGDMYEHLYSPAALARPLEQRVETAQQLVIRLEQLWTQNKGFYATLKRERQEMVETRVPNVRDQEWRMMNLEMVLKSSEVSHWTALTLVYRAISSASTSTGTSTYNAECIEAARAAFRCHEECMNLTSSSLLAKIGYLHWYYFLFSFFLLCTFCVSQLLELTIMTQDNPTTPVHPVHRALLPRD